MFKTYFLMAALCMTILSSCQEKKDHAQSALSQSLDSLIRHEHEANRFDGTVVIGSKDSIFYTNAIGTADRVWDIPMRLNHRFDICSINKSFIATLILMAVEEEQISLEDHLVDILKPYHYSGQYNEEITIHHLLTHTSGLPDYGGVSTDLSANHFRLFKRKHFTNAQYVDFISTITPVNQPEKQFYYSNFAYHLLIIILEDIYQKPFQELLEEKICKPLRLEHTFSTSSNRAVHANMVEGYNYDESTESWKRNQFIDLTLGKRIFSTSEDLYKWGKAMSAGMLLSDHSRGLMQTNHLSAITDNISYGYGWVVFDGKNEYQMGNLGIDKEYIIHGGATEGFKSMLINIEEGQYIIAFLANTGDQTNEIQLAQKIVHILIHSENEN